MKKLLCLTLLLSFLLCSCASNSQTSDSTNAGGNTTADVQLPDEPKATTAGNEDTSETNDPEESYSTEEVNTPPEENSTEEVNTPPEESGNTEEELILPEEINVKINDYVTEYLNISKLEEGAPIDPLFFSFFDYEYAVALPRIEGDSTAAAEINSKITELFYEDVIDVFNADFHSRPRIGYETSIHGDILSVAVIRFKGFYVTNYSAYTACMSISEGRLLTLKEVCDKLGYDYDAIIASLDDPQEDLFFINQDGKLAVFDYVCVNPNADDYMLQIYYPDSNKKTDPYIPIWGIRKVSE